MTCECIYLVSPQLIPPLPVAVPQQYRALQGLSVQTDSPGSVHIQARSYIILPSEKKVLKIIERVKAEQHVAFSPVIWKCRFLIASAISSPKITLAENFFRVFKNVIIFISKTSKTESRNLISHRRNHA